MKYDLRKVTYDIISEFDPIDPGTRLKDNHESLIGRLMLKRASGKKLFFYTILAYF